MLTTSIMMVRQYKYQKFATISYFDFDFDVCIL